MLVFSFKTFLIDKTWSEEREESTFVEVRRMQNNDLGRDRNNEKRD